MCRQQTFCCRTVTLSLVILLKGIRHRNGSIAEVLSVHGIHCSITSLKAGKVDEGETLRFTRLRVTHYLRCLQNDAEGRKGIVQKFLIDLHIQIANKDIGAHIQILLMRRCLIDAYRFPVELYHVHYFDCIVGVLLTQELHETVALMHLCHAVFGHVHIDCKMDMLYIAEIDKESHPLGLTNWTSLHKQFPEQRFGYLVVQAAGINGGICEKCVKIIKKRNNYYGQLFVYLDYVQQLDLRPFCYLNFCQNFEKNQTIKISMQAVKSHTRRLVL